MDMHIQLLSNRQIRARKEYACCICGRHICKDALYVSEKQLIDGKTHRELRKHLHCDAMHQALLMPGGILADKEQISNTDADEAIWEACCHGCAESAGCDLADMYSCEKCHSKILPEQWRGAAKMSVIENEEEL